jgi:hypothetical protein
MRYARAMVAALLAISSATAAAATDPPNNPTDEQTACAVAAAQDYEKANAAIAERATADGSMSIEDTIPQRRLSEDFCKRWATCLVTRITEPGLGENALRSTFAGCLSSEAEEHYRE